MIRRRQFISLVGGAAMAWPVAARGQQPAMPVIGFLSAGAPQALAHFAAAFTHGLKEAGYVEGRNVAIEYRWARGAAARLPELAADLVSRHVDVIAAFGTPSARAAKLAVARSPIPVVFANGSDPVADGLVASLNRPGGNITGVTSIAAFIVPKRLELLRAAVPEGGIMALLINPTNPLSASEREGTEAAARTLGQRLDVITARDAGEIEGAFITLAQQKIGALVIATDLLFYGQMERLAALALRHKLPAVAPLREFVIAGGLMSYGASIPDAYRQAGVYTGRVLKGEKPAELPIMQPTRFNFAINLNAAKSLSIEIPVTLLALADEVIE